MGVKYDFIDKILEQHQLAMPDLKVLRPDYEHYKTFLYQHSGKVVANVEGIPSVKNANSKLAADKHLAFFQHAGRETFDLLVTPEYSCPLSAVHDFVKSADFDHPGSLMVIGCESSTLNELENFSNDLNSDSLVVLMESDVFASKENKFVDPVAYVFVTKKAGQDKYIRVVLFQFKTYPMGATPIENEFMAFGTKRYIFRNDEESIYLATIICSEGLNIDLETDLRQFIDKPYLLLHPQLNLSPRTANLKQYRTNFFNNCAQDTSVEILCYNWAKDSAIDGEVLTYAHSAIYTKTRKILIDDHRINRNDKLGLYYNNWKNAKSSILIFDENEAVFCFLNSKVSKRRLNVQNQARYGPKMLERLVWEGKWVVVDNTLNQSLVEYCRKMGGDFEYFFNENMSFINRERLLSITVGEISGKEWVSPDKNEFFKISDDEYSRRINFFQDPDTKDLKIGWLNKYATFSTSLIKNVDWMPRNGFFQDLISDCKIHYSSPNYNYNVVGVNGLPACIVYAGVTDPSKVEELRALMLKSHPDDNTFPNRLLIVYHYFGDREVDPKPPVPNFSPTAPSFSTNNNDNPTAINRTKE
ncbi:hypothetical protein SAMN05421820_101865 [Pedobacter steynii]|uniref:Uncharacterized protein n=1 Tax=Pedobacter steynii TaxID=430522 RepID=A0A1G9LEN1_9SPHI|nr:hypothetical protein [Pedobacter steynii]NQX38826.1 hypothetical protein [Pedobacter steynii]SDL60412.1 hypothetical protein SAMN05421820_101865 [Pedobacter steynii]